MIRAVYIYTAVAAGDRRNSGKISSDFQFQMAEKDDLIVNCVKRAKDAFRSGKTKSEEFRKEQLRKLMQMTIDHEDDFVTALRHDLHKPRAEGVVTELMVPRNDIAHALNNLHEWMKPEAVEKLLPNKFDVVHIVSEPLGVGLIIGAWNYPVQLILMPLTGAIAAGNCAVLKPSEISSATAALFEKLIPKYLDKDCYPVVNGGVPETQKLLEHRFDKIFYTGGSMVGKLIMAAAAKNLTRVTLELGGKSPCFIDKGCDLQTVAKRLAWGKFSNSGQTCIAPDYVLCSPGIQSEFIKHLKETIFDFYGEDPKESPDYGRIINEKHFRRLKGLMGCGNCVMGGETDEKQRYISPTVFTGVKPSDAIMESEVFGPLLPIVDVEDAREAVEFINDRDRPLALYVFSNDKGTVDYMKENTSSGGFCANDTVIHAGVNSLPFGGVGMSGMGAYHGKHSFDGFSHKKGCLIKKLNMESVNSIRYPPYNENKLGWILWLLGEKEKKFDSLVYIPLMLMGVILAFIMKVFGLPRYFLTK